MGSCLHCVSKPRRYKETTTRTAVGEGIENHTKGPTSSAQVQLKVNRNTNLHETHERFLNKEKMYRENLEKLQGQLSRLGRQIEQERIEHKSEHKRFAEILSRNNEENRKLKLENETLLTRLSAVASARLTDGNANIADLSDVYRPTKLAEQYSELYDNEWTDAYDVIHKTETDEKACRILLELFCIIYQTCINKANHELDGVKDAIKTFLGGQDRGPPAEVIAKLKDQRKKNSADRKRALKQESRDKIMQILQSKALRNEQKMKQFLNKSISMCWLMAVQDPPVFIDVNYEECDKLYDSNVMKTYTKSGDYIDFLVWPPLFLHKDGNLLCKGVCQCKEVIGLHV